MLKLKDCHVIEISDDTEDFYEFGGTWSSDIHRKMHNISFETDTGKVVNLESFSDGYYGNTNGFEDVGEMYVTMMKMVYHGEMEEMTFSDLIKWMIEGYSNGKAIITIGSRKAYFIEKRNTGYTMEANRRFAFEWYAEELKKTKDKKHLLDRNSERFMDKLKPTYDAEKDVYVVDMDSEDLPITLTIDDYINED